MHAEAGMLFPYLQAFPPELPYHFHPMEEELLCRLQTSSGHLPPLNSPTRNMVKTPTVSDYDLGGEGDLFKAPEPIVEEPAMVLDHVAAAMWMISNGDAVISTNTFEVPDVDPIQNEQLLIDAVISTNTFGIPDVDPIQNEQLLIDAFYESSQPGEFPTRGEEEKPDEGIKKSVSSGSLESSTGVSGASAGPNLCAAKGIISGDVLVMRRACSEGDLQTYSNGGGMSFSGSTIHLPFERLLSVGEEDRRQKLSRYRKKKTKRNFGRKIKYACRKALADSQPRVRGRFAKTEDPEPPASSKPVSPVPTNM